MTKDLDIAVLEANLELIKGKQLYWAFSRKQIEHIVGDLEIVATEDQDAHVAGFSNWQGLELPVVSLEKFSGLRPRHPGESARGVVVKTSVQAQEGVAARLILEATHRLRMTLVNTSIEPVKIRQEELNTRKMNGLYYWEEDKVLALPDLTRIVSPRPSSHP